jgi:hypothetical protein
LTERANELSSLSSLVDKYVVLMELHRAIIDTTEMSKQVTKSHVRDAVHGVP